MGKMKAKLIQMTLIGILIIAIMFTGGLTYRYWDIETNLRTRMKQVHIQDEQISKEEEGITQKYINNKNQRYLSGTVEVNISKENEQEIMRDQEVVIIRDADVQAQLQASTGEEEKQMLQSFQAYYQSCMDQSVENMYPQVQVFQNKEHTWCMLLQGVQSKYMEQDVKLVQYIEGEAKVQWLGFTGDVQVARDYQGMAIQYTGREGLVYALYNLSKNTTQVELVGCGELNPMEEAIPRNYTYKVKQDCSPQDVSRYIFESTEYIMGREFIPLYQIESDKLQVHLEDNSLNSFYWSNSVEEAYKYWVLEHLR